MGASAAVEEVTASAFASVPFVVVVNPDVVAVRVNQDLGQASAEVSARDHEAA